MRALLLAVALLALPASTVAQETPLPMGMEFPNMPGLEVAPILEQAMRLAAECAANPECIRAGAQPNPIQTTFDRTCRAATEYAQLADTATTAIAIGWQMAEDHHGINDGTRLEEANPAMKRIVTNGLLFAGAKWLAIQGIKWATNALRNQGHRGVANLSECGAAAMIGYVAYQNHQIVAGLD